MDSGTARVTLLHGAAGGRAWPTMEGVSACGNTWTMPFDMLDSFLSMPRIARLHAAGDLEVEVSGPSTCEFGPKHEAKEPPPVEANFEVEEIEVDPGNYLTMAQVVELAKERGIPKSKAKQAVQDGLMLGADKDENGSWRIPADSFDLWVIAYNNEED